MNEETLFHLAREKPPAERTAFLDQACVGDAALRQRLEVLLQAHEDADSLLDRPPVGGEKVSQELGPQQSEREAVTRAPDDPVVAVPAPGTKVRYFGDYELLHEIARGGMGVVYKARQLSLNRTVALKMILAGKLASEADVQRFHREAEAAANLNHSNIVPIYEIGEQDGQHYFSMKLIEGTSLAQRAASFAGKPKEAAQLMAKVAGAVHEAHQHTILHRDLKPNNILLDVRDDPYVTDFGLARHVDGRDQHTRTGLILGTPSYMAPEQARSEKALTVAVDVYGLGAIFYELLTGRPPFRAETDLDTILQVIDRDPPRPRTLNARIDRDLETICLKCLEKEPRTRYPSALALAEDLERWSSGYTIHARPSGPAKKLLKWAKRNPTEAILVIVLACWLFDVRLPWHWASFVWAGLTTAFPFSLIGAWSLWRLVVVCARALGRPTPAPVEFTDAFLLPGAALAASILSYYPADFADRKTLALAILWIDLFAAFVIRWLWRRAQAGRLAVALRLPYVIMVFLGLGLLAGFVAPETLQLIARSGTSGDAFVDALSRIQVICGVIFLFLMVSVGTEFRQRGCVRFFRFIPWEDIESFAWGQLRKHLYLQLKLRQNPVPLWMAATAIKKVPVEQVLLQHQIPQTEPKGLATTDFSQFADQSSPAHQVCDPAALLQGSGVMQIISATAVFVIGLGLALTFNPRSEQTWELSRSASVGVLLMAAASAALGVIVFAGGRQLARLKSYRFCRLAAILAMLPLGFGFLLGLPGGIWVLHVLRKREIKAAFVSKNSERWGGASN
jgi:tRNA A-37 threonylcarbamoyl transferase component Bud32